MSAYSIRQLTLADLHLLPPLMKAAFGEDVPLAFFEWKYRDNPAGPFIGFVAEDAAGEIGAYYGVIPEKYSIDGQVQTLYQSCDTMTHPAHRRRGLFQLLATHCYDYLQQHHTLHVFGFGGAMSTPGFLKMGWKNLMPVYQLFYPKLFALGAFSGKASGVERTRDFAALEPLLRESNAHAHIHALKDAQAFAWRLANPLHPYECFYFRNAAGRAEGYIALRESGKRIYVLDCFFKTKAASRALTDFLKHRLRNGPARVALTMAAANSTVFRQLRKMGFVYSPFTTGALKRQLPFILLTPPEYGQALQSPQDWDISLFNHDTL